MRFDNFGAVRPDWIDHNGHMNVAYYVLALDQATDLLWETLGLGPRFRERGRTTFAAECWIGYRRELFEGAPMSAECWIMQHDAKRLLVRSTLTHATEGFVASEGEWLILSIDLATRRVVPWPDDVVANFGAFAATHPLPPDAPPPRQRITGNR
jgi:acyl-CoA thioester hydrolase